MERKSKEEIVNEGLAVFQKKYPGLRWIDDIESNKEMHEFSQYILSAFADQEMALLLEWINKHGYRYVHHSKMWVTGDPRIAQATPQQLLTIYKEQNGRKEDT